MISLKKDFFRLKNITRFLANKPFLISLFLLIYGFATVLFLAYVSRLGSDHPISGVFGWLEKYPLAFFVNFLLVSWLIFFSWFLSGRLFVSTVASSILIILFCLINHFKQTIRGEPFYPVDLLLSGEATNILGSTKLNVPIGIIVFIIVMVLFCVLAFFLKSKKISKKPRIIGSICLLILITLSFPFYFNNSGVQKFLGVEDAIWNQKYNYQQNGSLAAFLMQTSYLTVRRPTGYSSQFAKDLISKNESKNGNKIRPNIIVIMSESFWDPTRLPAVDFSIDPLEEFRKLQQESIYGDILVEPFGGNTANSEFEFLTGFSVHELPGGVAYQQYLKRKVPSLVSLLKDKNYRAEAIHPYEAWFWNRRLVYPMLGFDKFISLDDFDDSQKKGEFISDMAVMDRIIERYEKNKPTGKSYFAHIVTMQNHGWYNPDRYSEEELVVKTSSSKLSDWALAEINTFSQGSKDASDSLAYLVDYFRMVKEPTDIIFFGDHLPTLGSDYSYYRQAGYVGSGDLSDKDIIKLRSVPFLIWSNYRDDSEHIELVRLNHLAPLFLDRANLEMTSYFNFLNSLSDKLKACDKQNCYHKGQFLPLDKNSQDLINQRILQYYYLFAKDYN